MNAECMEFMPGVGERKRENMERPLVHGLRTCRGILKSFKGLGN